MDGTVILQEGTLYGVLNASQSGVLYGSIFASDILTGLIAVPAGYQPYQGPYTITSSFDERRLETSDKFMNDDVTVLSIPYSEVTNPSGGLTINIGG